MSKFMNIATRFAAAAAATYLVTLMSQQSFRAFFWHSKAAVSPAFTAVFALFEGSLALLAFWFAVGGSSERERCMMGRALIAGSIIGGAGFALGFFGPMVLTPSANQGPLLGIFITGPLGFALGCFASFVWLRARSACSSAS